MKEHFRSYRPYKVYITDFEEILIANKRIMTSKLSNVSSRTAELQNNEQCRIKNLENLDDFEDDFTLSN